MSRFIFGAQIGTEKQNEFQLKYYNGFRFIVLSQLNSQEDQMISIKSWLVKTKKKS